MKAIFSFLFLSLMLGVSYASAHVHPESLTHGGNYYNYYHGGYHHDEDPELGHSHHVTASNPHLRHWYHTHDGSHHFHDISKGHTDHTRPHKRYVSYRDYYYHDDDYEWDEKKVYGQSHPGRPTMGYGRIKNTTVKSCNCSGYRRY